MHLIQVGAGSGGIVVLDLVARDSRVTKVSLIEPDEFKPHNVERHVFGHDAVGGLKAELAAGYLRVFRRDLEVELLVSDLMDPKAQKAIERAMASSDLGICAVDNEPAKYHWDALMRKHEKPWTLGEVLSGGIGGFIHWFMPGGPCYGCVAGHLKREVVVDRPPTPDYSQPAGAVHEVTIPASKAAIHAIASLHAMLTLQMLSMFSPSPLVGEGRGGGAQSHSPSPPPQPSPIKGEGATSWTDPGFTTLLFPLQRVPGIFEEAYRPHRLRVPRSAECLMCQPPSDTATEDLDAALDQALARLGDMGAEDHA